MQPVRTQRQDPTKPVPFIFEDPGTPPLDETVPVPDFRDGIEGWRSGWGAYWRHQWTRPMPMDAMSLRLVVRPAGRRPPRVHVELDFEPGWVACHELVLASGGWVPSGQVTFHDRATGAKAEPTQQQRRRASLDRHLHRIPDLLKEGIDLDTTFRGNWFDQLIVRMRLSAPRSRRGRPAKIDLDRVDKLMTQGKSTREIARILGVRHGSVRNAMSRHRKRDVS